MYARIMVCVDSSPTSNKALGAALQLAIESGGRTQLRLVHVVDEAAYVLGLDQGGYSVELFKAMRDLGSKIIGDAMTIVHAAGMKADHVVFDSFGLRLGDTVARAARDWTADLIVVGTHGRRGVSHMLLGSGAEQIIRLAPVTLLVVRSTEGGPRPSR